MGIRTHPEWRACEESNEGDELEQAPSPVQRLHDVYVSNRGPKLATALSIQLPLDEIVPGVYILMSEMGLQQKLTSNLTIRPVLSKSSNDRCILRRGLSSLLFKPSSPSISCPSSGVVCSGWDHIENQMSSS